MWILIFILVVSFIIFAFWYNILIRLVMEEKEREEKEKRDSEREEELREWRRHGSGDSCFSHGTLKQRFLRESPPAKITTKAFVEELSQVSATDGVVLMNGVKHVHNIDILERNSASYKKGPVVFEPSKSNIAPVFSIPDVSKTDKASQWPDEVAEPGKDTENPEILTNEKEESEKKLEEPKDNNPEDEGCFVNCLYYSMQCCDCSIM